VIFVGLIIIQAVDRTVAIAGLVDDFKQTIQSATQAAAVAGTSAADQKKAAEEAKRADDLMAMHAAQDSEKPVRTQMVPLTIKSRPI